MPPDDFEDYLKFLAVVLRVRQSRQEAIFSELRDHFAERVAELHSRGADRERAAALAQQEFGDAAALAAQFMQIIRQRRRRIVMRSTIGAISAVVVGIVVTLAFWPAGGPALSHAVAQENPFSEEKPAAKSKAAEMDRDERVRLQLAGPTECEFVETPFSEVLNYLMDYHKINIYVKWRELNGRVESNMPITMSLKGTTLDTVLELIFAQLHDDLAYTVQDGVLMISTKGDLESKTVVQVYNLNRWLGKTPSKEEVEELIHVIRMTIAPGSWYDLYLQTGCYAQPGTALVYGGMQVVQQPDNKPAVSRIPSSSICSYQGTLVVNQSPANHQKISDLLKQLRESLEQKDGK